MDEEKGELETDLNDEVVIEPKMEELTIEDKENIE